MYDETKDIRQYDDIIDLPHHVSQRRPQMTNIDRAAQFSPFAALTGYDEAVRETARLTKQRIELDENAIEILDSKMQRINDGIRFHPFAGITYFVEDEKKAGGKYITARGNVKKIDKYKRNVLMENGTAIPIDDIIDIELTADDWPEDVLF